MQQVGELEPDTVIWRYLTISKFLSLVKTSALWFSKLQVFEDVFEGMTPEPARSRLKSQHRDMENWFQDEERKQQIRRSLEDNEENGRELIVANCWFIGDQESKRMWIEYAKGDEGVVIQSSARDLARSLVMSHKKFWIGKVNYIDPVCHDGMDAYEAHQAHLRAFLKSKKYLHENELRVATMNWVAPGCLNPDGSPQNEKQRAGLVYSPERPGIFVRVNLHTLIRGLRVAPGATDQHLSVVDILRSTAGIPIPALRSELS